MDFTPDCFLESLYEQSKLSLSFNCHTQAEWQQWKGDLTKKFIELLGGFPANKTSLEPEIIEEEQCSGYIRQRVVFTTAPYLQVPAYVLIPEGTKRKYPAVIACHGHGYGSRDIVGLKPDSSPKTGDLGYQKNFAVELVKRGFLVIAPELLGFGDRRLAEDKEKPLAVSSCNRITSNLLMTGHSIAGFRVYDIFRTIDYLNTRNDVDPARIGCMGISGGGLVAAFATALDQRIRVTVVSGYTNTFKDSIMSIHHCVDNFIPGILKVAEMPDLIGLIAPRPLLIEAGDNDPIFPVSGTLKAYHKLEMIYNLLESADHLQKDIFSGEHQISGAKSYNWLEHWLIGM